MQVHDTPLLINGKGATQAVTVGAGGADIYYGSSAATASRVNGGTLAVAGSTFQVTAPTWVVRSDQSQAPAADVSLVDQTPSAQSAGSAVPTIESQVALAAGATYQGDWIDLGTSGAKTVSVVAEADQAGTVYLEDSAIGQTLTPLDLRRLATTPTGVVRKQTDRRYVRLGYINGATLQSLFELNYVVA